KANDKVKKDFNATRDGLLTDLLKDACLDFQKDVKPWLGSEVAAATLPGASNGKTESIVLVRVKDEGRARQVLETSFTASCQQAGRRTRAFRIVNGFAVIATQDDAAANTVALDAVSAQAKAADGGLAKAAPFVRLVGQLHGDRLLVGYADGKQAADLAGTRLSSNGCDALGTLGVSGRVAFDVHAEASAVVLEAVGDQAGTPLRTGSPKLTEGLPPSTTGALTIFDIGGLTRTLLACTGQKAQATANLADQAGLDLDADILSWMGGEAAIVAGPFRSGRSLPDFGLVVQTTDHASAAKALDKLKAKLVEDGAELTDVDVAGTKGSTIAASSSDATAQPAVVLLPDRLILSTSPEFLQELAKPPSPGFGQTSGYRKVVGSATGGTQSQLVLNVTAIKDAIVASLPSASRDRYRQNVAPQLDPIDSVGLRVFVQGGFSRLELRVALR
ncbi:MAG: hypothetical protein QOG64_2217, partial [Acidimicrobiaceae bacterium]|nr:hypothetical protein [Acidimicrobiaceae bacterium]